MSTPFLVSGGGGALIKFFCCEEGRSFEGDVHLGRGALSDNYGNASKSFVFKPKSSFFFVIKDIKTSSHLKIKVMQSGLM